MNLHGEVPGHRRHFRPGLAGAILLTLWAPWAAWLPPSAQAATTAKAPTRPDAESGTWNIQRLSAVHSNHVWQHHQGALTAGQQWHLRTTVGAYWKSGHQDARWNGAAVEALEGFALSRGMQFTAPCLALHKRAFAATQRCRQAGCRDPLIDYIWMRCQREARDFKTSDFAAIDYEMATRRMAASNYAPGRVHLSLMVTINRWQHMRVTPTNLPALLAQAGSTLQSTLADPDLPTELAFLFAEDYLDGVANAKQDISQAWTGLQLAWPRRWAGNYVEDVIQGHAYMRWAWQARGTRWASEVPEEGWRLMNERLAVATTALERAWKKNPKDAYGPTIMIEVACLNGSGSEAVDVWFERAMLNDTNNRAACARKLHFLSPRWGGSAQELVEFGRRCLTNSAWNPQMADMLPKAHAAVAFEIPDSDDRRAYYRQPEVWADVKAAYQKLTRAFPLVPAFREDLAWWAEWTGHVQEGRDLLTQQ